MDAIHPLFKDFNPKTREVFRAYHKKHPHVWELFMKYACEIRETGRKHYEAKALMERVRYEWDIKNPKDDFIVNNNFTSLYARLLEAQFPSEFGGFFEKQSVKGLAHLRRVA